MHFLQKYELDCKNLQKNDHFWALGDLFFIKSGHVICHSMRLVIIYQKTYNMLPKVSHDYALFAKL
jgi:hypothetical protein